MTATTSENLTSERVEVGELDVLSFSRNAFQRGWSDGLPVIPPTESLVAEFVDASGQDAGFSVGRVFPSGIECTVEHIAVNAVMAGAPPESMRLLVAAVSALTDPAFDLAGVNATTAAVVPAFIVSGDVRDQLGIPYKHSSLGGHASSAPAIGRAVRLIMRNVAGQVAGKTSESVFGQPGRVTGIVTSEWIEESPWRWLGERRGVSGDSVTAVGVLGSANILDSYGSSGREILEVIAKSLCYMGNNNMDHSAQFAHQVVVLNPVWARLVAKDFASMESVQEFLFENAKLPLSWFPESLHGPLTDADDVKDGFIYLMDSPDDVSVIVNGGKGSLHATMLPGMSNHLPVTRSLDPSNWENSGGAR